MNKRIISVQDLSCVGQCSLTVALPILSALGIETAILPGYLLSTHTANFKGYTLKDLTDEFNPIINHWDKENIKFDGLYSGYVSPIQCDFIKRLILHNLNPNSKVVIDPVMGDNGHLYPGFDENIIIKMRELVSIADYIIPNITEACLLTNTEIKLDNYDQNYIEELIHKLHDLGAKNVLLTGVSFKKDKLGIAYSNNTSIKYYFTKKLEKSLHGTGDVYSSVFVGYLYNDIDEFQAASLAADFVVMAMEQTPKSHYYGPCFEQLLYTLHEPLIK